MRSLALLGVLSVVLVLACAETGCPEPEDIKPCVCTNSSTTYLLCKNITDAEDLRKVFVNSARYRYKEVHIEYSKFKFLPHDMFEQVPVIELHLRNVTLSTIFDVSPNALDELRLVRVENVRVKRGVIWKFLKPLSGLKILDIYYNSINTLGSDFSDNVPKGLEQISFYHTETKTLEPGVFEDFPKLHKISFNNCKLTQLSRDIFPTPWNGRILYFNSNKLESIAEDLFTEMPNLQTLGLRDNLISLVPESAFGGDLSKLDYFWLQGNPIKCDCLFRWVAHRIPRSTEFTGECESPKRLHGKLVKELTTGDFNC